MKERFRSGVLAGAALLGACASQPRVLSAEQIAAYHTLVLARAAYLEKGTCPIEADSDGGSHEFAAAIRAFNPRMSEAATGLFVMNAAYTCRKENPVDTSALPQEGTSFRG